MSHVERFMQIVLPASVSQRHQRMVQVRKSPVHGENEVSSRDADPSFSLASGLFTWVDTLEHTGTTIKRRIGFSLGALFCPLVKVLHNQDPKVGGRWDVKRWKEFAIEVGNALLPHEQRSGLPLRRENVSMPRPLPSAYVQ
eukprot:766457-Hanusia_phi.AAC.14